MTHWGLEDANLVQIFLGELLRFLGDISLQVHGQNENQLK